MEYNITIEVRGKKPYLVGDVREIVCDNDNYRLLLDFDEEWAESRTKTVLFIKPDGTCIPVLTQANRCKVPQMDAPGILYIGVKAGEELKTTTPLGIPLRKSAQTMCGPEAAQIPPDVAQQIIERLDELEVDMEALRKFVEEEGGLKGDDGITPHIGANGNWYIGDTDTGVKAKGEDGDPGVTPHIGENGNWYIGDTDTGVKAKGEDGDPGAPGVTPHIGANGNWFLGEEDTGVKAKGEDGDPGAPGITPHIGANGNWYIGNTDTGVKAKGEDGYTPVKGKDYFDGKDGQNGKDGYTPVKGVDYSDGVDGKNGKDGKDGYTPQKGVDYNTEADKAEMVQSVLAALPTWEGGSY